MPDRGVVTRTLAAAMSATVVALLLWRIRQGIDYTDEAFYIALPFRFALGDRPFVDELNITQTAGMVLYPFVKAYTAIAGSATGIFLFIRTLYLVFFGLVGWSAYALARTRLPRATALLLGTACMCFMPYGIAGLSYNTISVGLLSIGLFVVARWLLAPTPLQRIPRSPLLWAGFAHGAASFAYPTVTVAALSTAVVLVVLARGDRVRAALHYAGGGLGFGLVVAPFLLSAGPAKLQEVVAYTAGPATASGSLATRVSDLFTALLAQLPQLPFAAFVVVLAIVLVRRWPVLAGLALLYVPFLARGSKMMGPAASLGYVACFAMLGPLLCLGLRDRRVAAVLALGVAFPSAVAAVAWASTSGNGAVAAGIGLFPGAILAAIVLAMVVDETAKRWTVPILRAPMALSPALFLWVILGYATADDSLYRDVARPKLTSLVTFGPYKGLYTTAERRASLAALSTDITAHARGERALFFYDFPAGYLIAYRRPLAGSAWPYPIPSRTERDAAMFRERAASGDLVFRDGPQGRGQTPLDRDVASRCDVIVDRGSYTLYSVR